MKTELKRNLKIRKSQKTDEIDVEINEDFSKSYDEEENEVGGPNGQIDFQKIAKSFLKFIKDYNTNNSNQNTNKKAKSKI